jgi:hypothetical protein
MSTDQVATAAFQALEVPIADHAGYFLLRPTIAAYLSHLHRTGVADLEFASGAALWRRV